MYNQIKIACSKSAYEFLTAVKENTKNIFGCCLDLSFHSLHTNTFALLHNQNKISFDEFVKYINVDTNVEIYFNTNNACEYCNLLYIITHLADCNIYLIDTGREMRTSDGSILITTTTALVPVNYLEEYEKGIQLLNDEQKQVYVKQWDHLFLANTSLRFCKDREIISTDETCFDKEIKEGELGELCSLMNEYGLSEEWVLRSKELLSTGFQR
ncbi:MAG: hypothetical protein EOM11_04920, partial [Erysipelotrichia bacterium]|nr:hypothetical protein [Erysipelotrichia bacterium]